MISKISCSSFSRRSISAFNSYSSFRIYVLLALDLTDALLNNCDYKFYLLLNLFLIILLNWNLLLVWKCRLCLISWSWFVSFNVCFNYFLIKNFPNLTWSKLFSFNVCRLVWFSRKYCLNIVLNNWFYDLILTTCNTVIILRFLFT